MATELQIEYYNSSVSYIKNDLSSLANNCVKLGFHLHEVNNCKYYIYGNYDSIYDFAECEFGLKRSTVNRYMNICFCFSKNGRSMYLDEKYEKYNYSQLCELLSMDDSSRRKVNPAMTIKQIREIKQCIDIKDDLCDVAQIENKNEIINYDTLSQPTLCDVAQEIILCECNTILDVAWNFCPMCSKSIK